MRLLERGDQAAQLAEALRRADARRGGVMLVSGPAGIGKTSLVRNFARVAADAGATVRVGACDDLHAPRAFAPFRDIASSQSRLGRALRDNAERAEVLDAILDELDDPLRAVVLILEDLQWADDATLDAVLVVSRRIEGLGALLVVTFRDDEIDASHPLRRVLGNLGGAPVERIELAPLSREAVATLAGRSVDEVADLYTVTGGNPFYVQEMLASPDTSVPMGVRDAVLRRLIALPEATRRAVEALSVIPSHAERWLVNAVVEGGARAFDDAERHGIVVADARTVRFAHEIARRAVESQLTTGTRVTLNAAVAAALVERGADATRILHHAVEAGDAELVVHHGLVAAREAARLGVHRTALEAYQQVHRAADQLPPGERAGVALEYAYELQLGGRHADAVAVAAGAVDALEGSADVTRRVDALLVLSRAAYWHRGQTAAMPHAQRAVDLLAGTEPTPTLAMAYAHMARLHLLANRNEEARLWSERALAAAEAVQHAPAEAGARITHGSARLNLDEPDGMAELDRGFELARRHGFHESVLRGYYQKAVEYARRGQLEDGVRVLGDGITYAREHEVRYAAARLSGLLGVLVMQRGDFAQAREILTTAVDDEPEPTFGGIQARAWLAQLLARVGDDGAIAMAQDAWDLAAGSGEAPLVGAAAVAVIETAWLAQRPQLAHDVAEVALPLADETRHRWYAGDLRMYLRRAGLPVDPPPPDTRMLSAHAAALRDDHVASAAEWGRLGYAYEQAVELVWCDDRDAMLDGVRRLDDMGAVGTANLARALLRSRGVTSVPRGPTRRTRENPAGLTDRQVGVLTLLSQGLTNAEIAERLVLSVRTVDHHVSAILGKLDVSTRQEAADKAVDLGLVEGAPAS